MSEKLTGPVAEPDPLAGLIAEDMMVDLDREWPKACDAQRERLLAGLERERPGRRSEPGLREREDAKATPLAR